MKYLFFAIIIIFCGCNPRIKEDNAQEVEYKRVFKMKEEYPFSIDKAQKLISEKFNDSKRKVSFIGVFEYQKKANEIKENNNRIIQLRPKSNQDFSTLKNQKYFVFLSKSKHSDSKIKPVSDKRYIFISTNDGLFYEHIYLPKDLFQKIE